MKRCSAAILLSCIVLVAPRVSLAEAPVAVEEVAPIDDVQFEIKDKIKKIGRLLGSEETFESQKDVDIRQGFGVLACLGQVLAEHDDAGKVKIDGPSLRDAALKYSHKGSYADAKDVFALVESVAEGKKIEGAATEHPWNKLIRMHPMMEEMSARKASLSRVLRRPRGRDEEPVHATTLAVLALAMEADTHEVKDPTEIPQWKAWSEEFRKSAIEVADAVRAKDADKGRAALGVIDQLCTDCHEKFRD